MYIQIYISVRLKILNRIILLLDKRIERALQAADIAGRYMGVDLGGLDIGVAEQFLEAGHTRSLRSG